MKKLTQKEICNLLNGNWGNFNNKIDIQPGIYRHFKGKLYEVLGVARDSDNCDKIMVHYRQLEESDFPSGTEWIRPIEEFCDVHPSGKQRFVFQGEVSE